MSETAPAGPTPLRASDEIQGDVLTPLHAGYAALLFLRFGAAEGARRWLAALVPRVATTRAVVEWDRANRPGGADTVAPGPLPDGAPAATWTTVALTARGLARLDPALAAELRDLPAFRDGPAARAALLGDVGPDAPRHWVVGGPSRLPDALVSVEADRPADRDRAAAALAAEAEAHGVELLRAERGDVLPGALRGHEHFGFRDCISQPGVAGFHPPDPERPGERAGQPGTRLVAAGEFVFGQPRHDGSVRPHPEWMADGSFRVFRRLAQDVAGWRAQLAALRATLPPDDPLTEEGLAARLIGRWPSGVPLAQCPHADPGAAACGRLNDFDFGADPQGHLTPHFAHVRKMHPRGEPFYDERRRIIRRGIPYGPPYEAAPRAERGLLFSAFMTGIEDQFEFLQRLWANTDDFPRTGAGADALIGSARPPAPAVLRRPGLGEQPLALTRHVRTTGCVYALAPSLSTLRRLAGLG